MYMYSQLEVILFNLGGGGVAHSAELTVKGVHALHAPRCESQSGGVFSSHSLGMCFVTESLM